MPSRRGWSLLGAAGVLALGGWVLGLPELFALAAAGAALVAAGMAHVHRAGVRLEPRRHLRPAGLPAGATVGVELRVRNGSGRRAPAFTLADQGTSTGASPPLLVGSLDAGQEAQLSYTLTAPERGIHSVGPLRVVMVDPFGVARRSAEVLGASTLTVYPCIEVVEPPPQTSSLASTEVAGRPSVSLPGAEEFASLHPYVEGDDLRRVHWPSSARLDELVVRHHEMPRPWETVVVLDVRRAVHDRISLERTLSAAASVVVACAYRGGLVRLVATDGSDSGVAAGDAHVEAVLRRLAVLKPAAGGSLAHLSVGAGCFGRQASVVAITTSAATAADLVGLGGWRDGPDWVALVVFERGPGSARRTASTTADVLVRVATDQSFARAWRTALGAAAVGVAR